VYDPAQARIEAESVKAIIEKYQANEDPAFRTREREYDRYRQSIARRLGDDAHRPETVAE